MLSDIQVFVYLTILRRKCKLGDDTIQLLLRDFMEAKMPRVLVAQFINYSLNKVQTKTLVHGLRAEGYSHKDIADLLGITPASVAYHIANPPKQPFTSELLQNVRKTKEAENDYTLDRTFGNTSFAAAHYKEDKIHWDK